MKQGSLSERYLKKAVFDKLPGKSQEVLVGLGIGADYSQLAMHTEGNQTNARGRADSTMGTDSLITADGSGETPAIAFYKALNNFSCSFGTCIGARILLLFPEKVKESEISCLMEQFADLAQQEQIRILGGDSKVVAYVSKPYFHVVMIGQSCERYQPDRKNIKLGYSIVCAKETGILGTNMLLTQNQETLQQRFASAFLNQAAFGEKAYSIRTVMACIRQENLITDCGICYAHDVSESGIYGALWQSAEWMKKGIIVDNSAILLRQETIELCEASGSNPYLIDGTGSVLMICEKGRALVQALKQHDFPAAVIGQVTKEKERLVRITDNDIRTLESC